MRSKRRLIQLLLRISPTEDRSEEWIENIRKKKSALNSSRMAEFKRQFDSIITDYLDERAVVTAEHVGVLDIVSIVLEASNIKTIFYDGRVAPADRESRLKTFQTSRPGRLQHEHARSILTLYRVYCTFDYPRHRWDGTQYPGSIDNVSASRIVES